MRYTIGVLGRFYEDADSLIYPPSWLNLSNLRAKYLKQENIPRNALAIGVDPGEGSSNTSGSIVDELGLIDNRSILTQDTAQVVDWIIDMIHEFDVPHHKVCLDRGGGGKQHADVLRRRGYKVKTVGFGEAASSTVRKKKEKLTYRKKVEDKESKYSYKNMRAEMYVESRELFDPSLGEVFAIDEKHEELLRQMSVIPMLFDPEGRVYLPPKKKQSQYASGQSLTDLLGNSPDEADSFVLAVHAMRSDQKKGKIRAF